MAQSDDRDQKEREDDRQAGGEAAYAQRNTGAEARPCPRLSAISVGSARARFRRGANGGAWLSHPASASTSSTAALVSSGVKGFSIPRLAPPRIASSRQAGSAVSTLTRASP